LETYNNFEGGSSATLGFDYELEHSSDRNLKISAGQIINQKNNKNMPSSSSLDRKVSDFVGNSTLNINEKINLNYNFALDENYKDLNYNEVGAGFLANQFKLDVNYLEEKEHIGNQEYLKTKIEIGKADNGIFSASTKRNLITNSAEYYNLSYEYLNDCLRAGLVYRREFYNDSELEPEESLMFKITLTPIGSINSPSFK
jgi:LPS-assembly protein